MTQLERAQELYRRMRATSPSEDDVKALTDLVGEAQNGPPEGAADGSIDEQAWTVLASLAEAARKYNDAVDTVANLPTGVKWKDVVR